MQENQRPQVFRCPHCHQPLLLSGSSLICQARHSYDLAREGYVNLLGKKTDTLFGASVLKLFIMYYSVAIASRETSASTAGASAFFAGRRLASAER